MGPNFAEKPRLKQIPDLGHTARARPLPAGVTKVPPGPLSRQVDHCSESLGNVTTEVALPKFYPSMGNSDDSGTANRPALRFCR